MQRDFKNYCIYGGKNEKSTYIFRLQNKSQPLTVWVIESMTMTYPTIYKWLEIMMNYKVIINSLLSGHFAKFRGDMAAL